MTLSFESSRIHKYYIEVLFLKIEQTQILTRVRVMLMDVFNFYLQYFALSRRKYPPLCQTLFR